MPLNDGREVALWDDLIPRLGRQIVEVVDVTGLVPDGAGAVFMRRNGDGLQIDAWRTAEGVVPAIAKIRERVFQTEELALLLLKAPPVEPELPN